MSDVTGASTHVAANTQAAADQGVVAKPNTLDGLKKVLGEGTTYLQSLARVGAKPGQDSTIDVLDGKEYSTGTSIDRDKHQRPLSADEQAVVDLLSDPNLLKNLAELQVALETARSAMLVLFPQQATVNNDRTQGTTTSSSTPNIEAKTGSSPVDSAHTDTTSTATKDGWTRYSQSLQIGAAVGSSSSLQRPMFSEAAITLSAIFAEIAQMKKGQAAAFAKAALEATRAMIDGAHTQAALEIQKGQTEAQAAFMSAALQAVGSVISILGCSRALQMSKAKPEPTVGLNDIDAAAVATRNSFATQLTPGKVTAISTMYGAYGDLFSKVGTSLVEGVKANEVGHIEAQKVVLNNAMQILGQMMSKWGDEEKSAHDEITKLFDSLQQLFQKLLYSADKLSP